MNPDTVFLIVWIGGWVLWAFIMSIFKGLDVFGEDDEFVCQAVGAVWPLLLVAIVPILLLSLVSCVGRWVGEKLR